MFVKSVGSVEKPRLLTSSPSIDKKEKRKTEKIITDFHGIADTSELYSFMRNDDIFREVGDILYGFGKTGRWL